MNQSKNVILIDNFDSFTHNLLHLLQTVRPQYSFTIYRNHDNELLNQTPDALIVGPGPMTPAETGLLKLYFEQTVVKKQIPTLGVCLGMQFLGWYFGIGVTRSTLPAHGTATDIEHAESDIFQNIFNISVRNCFIYQRINNFSTGFIFFQQLVVFFYVVCKLIKYYLFCLWACWCF